MDDNVKKAIDDMPGHVIARGALAATAAVVASVGTKLLYDCAVEAFRNRKADK